MTNPPPIAAEQREALVVSQRAKNAAADWYGSRGWLRAQKEVLGGHDGDLLVQAFARFERDTPTAALVVAGDALREALGRIANWQAEPGEEFADSFVSVTLIARAALATTPPAPSSTVADGSGWVSPSLGRAYAEVERLRDSLAQHPESGIDETLRRALEAIEAADCELTGMAI